MLQLTGFWLALVTFLTIWWGHVGVRKLEAHLTNVRPAMTILVVLGLALNIASLFTPSVALSGSACIIGITLMWDAFELHRQQKRIQKGHAPLNLKNPRHAAYYAEGKGTLVDLLGRDPTGQPPAAAHAPLAHDAADYHEAGAKA